jgi:hypothetical protein
VGEVGRGLEVALSGIVKDIYYYIEQRKTIEKTCKLSYLELSDEQ